AGVSLQADEASAHRLQATVDELVREVHEQREALDEYLLSADPEYLDRYRLVASEATATITLIRTEIGHLAGIEGSLAMVESQNVDWRTNVAEPAIAAVQSGSADAIKAAITRVLREETTQTATADFLVVVDKVAETAGLGVRSDSIDRLRVAATWFGVASLLAVAGLSLWFVRRYGQRISRDSRRREQASAERIQIVASLHTLRTQASPEATATVIAQALAALPGIHVAGVLEVTPDGLLAMAVVGDPGFPLRAGEYIPEPRGVALRERTRAGPWAEGRLKPATANAYEDALTGLGIKGQAYAPILSNGELIGLVALATMDDEHARHLVEDLPAVGEFASVAEMILAPALIARRERMARRASVGATIASAAFRPVFQPVVDLGTGATVGFEALTRFEDGTPPDVMFATAIECGMGIELETVTLRAALLSARGLPKGTWLSLNVSPAILAQRATLVGVLEGRPAPVVLEVTEHEAIDAYAPLRDAMTGFGPQVRLAVDDVGAGVANFNHLVELRPDFVKIDIGLVRGVDRDPSRRAVVVGLVHFAAEAGCQVIAEGIETDLERGCLTELGVQLGQGYLLGRPAPVSTWEVPAAVPRAMLTPARVQVATGASEADLDLPARARAIVQFPIRSPRLRIHPAGR
ncbi:MAG: hypothetical protein QOI37_328, partial [Chloroflexota bacterium]|nr:hypothetical protein [Chloroflexota bacterium]